MLRWRVAILVSAAIAISYLDRQTLPWMIKMNTLEKEFSISSSSKAFLDSAFLLTYGLMYLGGGRLLDYFGTRRGFLLTMAFWSVACASHSLASNHGFSPIFGISFGVIMLAASRLLLGIGEGGGFPAATRVVAEWFPVRERSTAMGIINAGTAVGAVAAPWLIKCVIDYTGWFNLAPWRWVYLITGGIGLVWTAWWYFWYQPPDGQTQISPAESSVPLPAAGPPDSDIEDGPVVPFWELVSHRETMAVVGAKFLSDAAWYFYMFWLPKFLIETFGYSFDAASGVGWIPYAASGVGCLMGGGLSSWLLARHCSVNASRKIALGISAAFMPWVMLVPGMHSVGWVIFIFSLAFFGQQSWSTLIMILPTDMIPKRSVGTLAGLVGFGGAMGGVVLGQVAGYLRDHHYSYTPILMIAGSLHLLAFLLICLVIPSIKPLNIRGQQSR
jgi:ACS family hexuronate transporter-like MFS transporter